MPLWEAFTGGSYRSRSATISADVCVNMYPEVIETSGEAKHSVLYGTPGQRLLQTLSAAGNRTSFSQDGLTLTVSGGTLYQVDMTANTAASIGSIANDGLPVFYASNGRGGEQVAIVGGGELKILDLDTMTLSSAISLPLTNAPVMVDFLDGYFILSEADTVRVWFSALEDGTSWNALDFFAVSETSTNVVGIKVLRDRIWVGQSQTTLIYYDTGDSDDPFQPYPGSVMQEGWVSPYGVMISGEGIYWLAQDNQGRSRMVSASDYSPTVISTPAISFSVASYPSTEDVEMLAYEQEGHPFVAWTFPSAPNGETWCYDTREGQWHQRQGFDSTNGTLVRWRARGAVLSGNTILTGDYSTGALYALDLDTFTDNGTTIKRIRRAPYISAENQWTFLDRAELGVQSGVGLLTGQGSAPVIELRISRDAATTWGAPIVASLGAQGQYLARAIWRRLGRVRADRMVVEVSQTDPVRPVWGPGLWLRAHAGSGAL